MEYDVGEGLVLRPIEISWLAEHCTHHLASRADGQRAVRTAVLRIIKSGIPRPTRQLISSQAATQRPPRCRTRRVRLCGSEHGCFAVQDHTQSGRSDWTACLV